MKQKTQNIAVCDIHLEKKDIEDKDFWASEVARILIEYANMILNGTAGRLHVEKFACKGNITMTICAGQHIIY